MKLFYWKSAYGKNFGDDLNPWLWQQLIPEVFDEDENAEFIGIGTLLNDQLRDRVPKPRRIAIFSSGVGYGKHPFANLPVPDDFLKIYCVRGPLSAQALGVAPKLAVTDGALLVRRVWKPADRKKINQFAFMPHISQARRASKAWKYVCEQVGFQYIDPCGSVEEVLTAIDRTEVLITEAMHGAIVADALRVPWIPVHASSDIFGFKWLDWCFSIGVDYQPRDIEDLVIHRANLKSIRSAIMDWRRNDRAASQLAHIAKTCPPFLSDESRSEDLVIELEERLQQFKNDVANGYFSQLIEV